MLLSFCLLIHKSFDALLRSFLKFFEVNLYFSNLAIRGSLLIEFNPVGFHHPFNICL